jgi:hypothetical protein
LPGSALVASAIAGSVPIIELAHGNMPVVSRTARCCVAVRSRRRGERGIRITLLARRIQARGACDEPPEPLRLPSPLNQLHWDIAQSEFGVQGADFIGVMGALLLHSTQSRLKPYRIDSRADSATLPHLAAQSQIPPAAYLGGSGSEGGSHAAGIPPT